MGLKNFLYVPGNWAKVSKNHDAPKAVSATLSVLTWSGAIFALGARRQAFKYFFLSPFHWKLRPSRVSLESLGLRNIHHVAGNRATVGQNHDGLKAVSATLSVLKWSGAIFRPRRSKPHVPIFFLCPFQYKPRQSRVSLESVGLKNIHHVPGNRAKVGQNQDQNQGGLGYSISFKMKWGYI